MATMNIPGYKSLYGIKDLSVKTEIFKHNARLIHGNKYNYDKSYYKNDKEKIVITCPIHGDFLQSYNDHVISKHGCPLCNNNIISCQRSNEKSRLAAKERFFEKVKTLYDYDFSEFIYINTLTNGKVICPRHGIFYRCPNKLINRRQGCSKCSIVLSNRENILIDLFKSLNIKYTTATENKFEDCISENKNYLTFDFYLEDKNILIEIDGMQHFKLKFIKDENELKRVHNCDLIRNEWALEHDVIFIRFSYNMPINKFEKIIKEIFINNNFNIQDKDLYISYKGKLLGFSDQYYHNYEFNN